MTNENSNPFKNDELVKDENIEASTENETPVEETKEEAVQDNKLQEEYDKLNQQYIRLAADFDNYRKRQEQERENLIKFGTESTLKKMIEVLDNFDRGQKALEGVEDCEKVKESFNLVHKQVWDSLSKLGLEEIKAVGEEFDPNFHDAIMQVQSDTHKAGEIVAEMQKGYKYKERVLRPSMVSIAKA